MLGTPGETLTIAFYNVENLWDTVDDPSPGDDEFTPGGPMRWTPERLERKLSGVARAIRGIGQYEGPDLIGICEIENRAVLERLVSEFLPAGAYAVAHAESPDERGIDVALLYRSSAMELTRLTMHRIDLGAGQRPTRDIMEATFAKDGRSFTVLVNHWPSRSGGEAESEPRRIKAAQVAASIVDSLLALDANADIILMGDLNDEPANRSVSEWLDAPGYQGSESLTHRMINVAAPVAGIDTIGSYFYRKDWETIDQIILSSRGALDDKGIMLYETVQTIHAPEFLRDSKADPIARPPYRTYRGKQYIAGTSDHFSVFVRVGWKGGPEG